MPPFPLSRRARWFAAAATAILVLLAASCAHVLAEESPANPAFGEQKTVVLLVNFADRATEPLTPAAAHALVFGEVGDFYWEASYGRTLLVGDTHGWFTVPVSRDTCNPQLVAAEADKAAAAAGIDLAAYDRRIYLSPQNACSATGYNSGIGLPSRTSLFTDAYNARVVAHELGHNFGLSHSQALDCGATVLGGDCRRVSYGDAADTMGSGATPHFNAFQKELLGWLGSSGQPELTHVSASGRYRIAPLSTPGAASKALRLPRAIDPLTGEMNYYYVEYRQPVGFDAVLAGAGNLAQGVLVHTGGANQYSMLLDMTPDSDPSSSFHDIRDSALAVGRTYADAAAGIRITLVSADATGATVDVAIEGDAGAGDGALATSVSTDRGTYARGDTVHMSALVSRDGVAVAGARVEFQVTPPSGRASVVAAASGADGVARASYVVSSRRQATGAYGLRADAASDGKTVSSTSGFSVR